MVKDLMPDCAWRDGVAQAMANCQRVVPEIYQPYAKHWYAGYDKVEKRDV